MHLPQAKEIADRLVCVLTPYSKIINIAGSIHRKKADVKDIEIVLVANKIAIGQQDMFGDMPAEYGVPVEFTKIVNGLGKIIKGNTDGKYMQIALNEGINLDLFMPDDFDYYRQFAVRTGSGDYTKNHIASGWKRIGWCGSDKGLRKMRDCVETKKEDGKSTWKCVNPNAELPPIWKSEEEFFEWLGIKWIDPTLRHY